MTAESRESAVTSITTRCRDSLMSRVPIPILPNFFLVGAPKTGTTSLYHFMDQHPQIYMSPIKEPNFFAAEVREENFDPSLRGRMQRDKDRLREYLSSPVREKRFGALVNNWEDYIRLFENATNELAIGEASVCYLWSPTAPKRIAERIPNAKVLALFRNPAERAFSQYLHGVSSGVIHWSLREHIDRDLRRRSNLFCASYPFLEMGLYTEQIERYLTLFGSNVWIGVYEDFATQPEEVLRSIFRFLGVDAEFRPDMSHRHLQAPIQGSSTPMPQTYRMEPEDRMLLADFYREDVRRLSNLLNRDLEHWTQHCS